MWQHTYWSNREFGASITDLLESTARNLMLTTMSIIAVLYLVVNVSSLWPLVPRVSPILLLFIIPTAYALHVLPRRFVLAQAVWLAGVAAATTASLLLLQQPEVAFLFSLLPLLSVVVLGWSAGLLAEGVVVVLVGSLHIMQLTPSVSFATYVAVSLGGAMTWLVGWQVASVMLSTSSWALASYNQAREKMEEARNQRLELKQIQEDLVQANRSMARMADRLRVMNQIAEEARRAKEEFVANVSHELRTPLNLVIGFTEMITQTPQLYGEKLPTTLMADLAVIERNAKHLAGLINDVLDLSQVDAGRMALSKEWTALPELVNEAAVAVRPLFGSKALYLKVDVPASLPRVFCDSTRVRQVVLNLLSNAGRFMTSGGVNVRAWEEGTDIAVSVADTGPGISVDDQRKLFEPFQQADSSIRRKHGGTGLGLAISKQFVEMHGGRMWLDSNVNVGTTFYFTLPEHAQPSDTLASTSALRWFNPDQQLEERTRRSMAPPPHVPNRLIIVEETNVLRRILQRHADDLETIAVRGIEDVKGELAKDPVQAVIVNSPDMQSVLGQALRSLDLPHLTPLIHCWLPGPEDAAQRLGVIRYLTKPVGRDMLLAVLEQSAAEAQTILLADDDPDFRQLVARVITAARPCCRVLHAANGKQALTILRSHQPGLLILDLLMPGMNGYQVLSEKAQDDAIRRIPVVALSARDPTGEHVTGEILTVVRSGGLSIRELLDCLRGLTLTLSRSAPTTGREPTGTTGA